MGMRFVPPDKAMLHESHPAPEAVAHDHDEHHKEHPIAFTKQDVHAAGLLHAPTGDGGAPERARQMARLQHGLGNARLSRLLKEQGVPSAEHTETKRPPERK